MAETAQESRNYRQLAFALLGFAVPLGTWMFQPQIGGLDPWGVRVLAVVVGALILWLTECLPIGITSLAVLGLLALVGPGESAQAMRGALAGFESPAPFFMLCSLALGMATVATGLAQRFARLLVRGAKGSGNRLYWQMIAMMPIMAILVPSALTRSAMLIPAYEAIFENHRIQRGHPLPRLIMLATATIQIQASTAVLTGGAVPIVAGALLGDLSWARWFMFMALPNYAILFIFATVLFLLYRPGPLPRPIKPEPEQLQPEGRITAREWRALIIILATTTLWLTDSIHGLDPTIPALIGSTALFLPVAGVLTWNDLERASPWMIFLVTGSSLSLAVALTNSGAAAWLAQTMIDFLPLTNLSLVPLVLALMGMVTLVNVMLPNRTAVLGITIPLIVSLAPPLGLNPLAVGFMVPIIAQTTNYYPVQLATALVTFRTRHYSAGELFRAGVLLTLVSVGVIFLIALPWWSFLGESIRI